MLDDAAVVWDLEDQLLSGMVDVGVTKPPGPHRGCAYNEGGALMRKIKTAGHNDVMLTLRLVRNWLYFCIRLLFLISFLVHSGTGGSVLPRVKC